jgi:hypothetical protein
MMLLLTVKERSEECGTRSCNSREKIEQQFQFHLNFQFPFPAMTVTSIVDKQVYECSDYGDQ